MSPRLTLVLALTVTPTILGREKAHEPVQLTPEKPFATVKVGQTVYFGLEDPRPPKSFIRGLVVKIDGHWVELKAGECKRTGTPGTSWFSFIDVPRKPDTYKVQVKPLYRDRKKKGEWVEFRLTVEK